MNYQQLSELYNVPAQIYYIEIYRPYTKNDFLQLCELVRYHCKKDDVSYLIAFSTTDSRTAKITFERNGKRGRPKRRITGRKISGHCHNLFCGNNRSCRQTVLKISKAINKKEQRKITKINSISSGADVHDYIGYILKQSDIIRGGGDFDFRDFYNKGI